MVGLRQLVGLVSAGMYTNTIYLLAQMWMTVHACYTESSVTSELPHPVFGKLPSFCHEATVRVL